MTHSPEASPTTLEQEREEQLRWKLLPQYSGLPLFDRLVENEFLPQEVHQQQQLQRLRKIIQYARDFIPYYQTGDSSMYQIGKLSDLSRLPILTKQEVIDHFKTLQCAHLPRGGKAGGITSSSGTTGRPVSVAQTERSMRMFSIFRQREARWFRQDPTALAARMRFPQTFPRQKNGSLLANGETYTRKRWSHQGLYFETGPEVCCNVENTREWQIEWLKKHRPKYLESPPTIFEELIMANNQKKPVDSLECLVGIGTVVTDSMRSIIERIFEIPIHQNYGMNEAGIVAARCSAQRYHIHTEHCFIEIVDQDGLPVKPGETGRVIVTPFKNLQMPLLRYDTGDLAIAVEGACPCGRTLPSIGNIVGRYWRYASLPEGSFKRFMAIYNTMKWMPPELLVNLRQNQVHLYRDMRFEIRLRTVGPLSPEFYKRITARWIEAAGESEKELLSFKEVDHIEGSPGGKHLEFSSDFFSDEDRKITNVDI